MLKITTPSERHNIYRLRHLVQIDALPLLSGLKEG